MSKGKETPKLSNASLLVLNGKAGTDTALKTVTAPAYDRSKLSPGILHLGVGNFHRAHMANYMDDLFHVDFENAKEWGMVGAGIMHFDAAKRDMLESQDWLQTLVERDAGVEKAKVIGSMIDFLHVDHVKKEHTELQAAMMDPNIKIISLTVTEGGYYLHVDGSLDLNDPSIKNDIANPSEPHTIFGMIIKALDLRRKAGMKPFTVMSCDNIPQNGEVLRGVINTLAIKAYPKCGLADWITKEVAFPNSMVDRITPATTDAQRTHIKEHYGFEDACPIFCEPFRQWVIEDIPFSNGRPAFEKLENVKFVKNVIPFEDMKIRILNGGHASLCYPAALLDVEYVHQAMEHPTISRFLDALERNEIIPTIPPVPDTDLREYWDLIQRRFSNPTIGDTITRICYDGASRQPKFIVPVVMDHLKEAKEAGGGAGGQQQVDGMALVSAMWCRYCQGKTESGATIPANDPIWDELQEKAKKAVTDPNVWLSMSEVYGEIGQDPVFQEAFAKQMQRIEEHGVEKAMLMYAGVPSKNYL